MKVIRKKDNRGSAIVTVLIAVTFMSVLITTLLYITASNYKTKQIDYMNKKSFYKCETTLEEIKALFVVDASNACEIAYKNTMLNYALKNSVARENMYKKIFVEQLQKQWDDRFSVMVTTNLQAMQTNDFGLSATSKACVTSVGDWDYQIAAGTAELKNICVSIVADGYTTFIETDIFIEAPKFDWSVDEYVAWPGGAVARNSVDVDECVSFNDWKK